jgi:predicted nucleotidyltransferase/uncharacterized protein (UPF0332 family)
MVEKKKVKNSQKEKSAQALKEPKNDKDIAMEFASQVQKKFDRMVKASILFGSQARNDSTTNSDIDIVLIIDDAAISWDLELISWYREELAKIIANNQYGADLHINTVKLTTFWSDLMHGDPVVINIIRYGEPLIDYGGFFNPLKALLVQGRISSTVEAVYAALQRAPDHLARSRMAEMSAVEGVYWCMIDSAQAALITAGKMPPSPEHIPAMLKETFVDSKVLPVNYVQAIRDLYLLHKGISHGEITQIKGSEIDKWQNIAEKFLTAMTKIINDLVDAKK